MEGHYRAPRGPRNCGDRGTAPGERASRRPSGHGRGAPGHGLESRVLAMDETPIKAGVKEPGKMRQGYFWPIYGEDDEIVFPYAPTREHGHVEAFLGEFRGTLVSDGYEAYARYAAKRAGVRHAQCWAHARRTFEQARDGEPEAAGTALALIGALYGHEKTMRARKLEGAAKLAYRREHGVPVAERFFAWCREQCGRADLLPKSPLAKALKYALDREAGLSGISRTRTCQWIQIILSAASGRSPWAGGTGCSPGRNSARSASGWSRACSRPARCRAWTRTPIWSMSSNASASIPRAA